MNDDNSFESRADKKTTAMLTEIMWNYEDKEGRGVPIFNRYDDFSIQEKEWNAWIDTWVEKRFLGINQLTIYNIKDMGHPIKMSGLDLKYPAGMALGGNDLWLCDGPGGLLKIDVSSVKSPKAKVCYLEYPCKDLV